MITPIDSLKNQIGVCSICQTIYACDEDLSEETICHNCGESTVFSIVTLCDMSNAYLDFKNI